jgi:hypothetical protein
LGSQKRRDHYGDIYDNIKIDVGDVDYENVNYIKLSSDGIQG